MFGSEPKEERFTYDAIQALPDTAKYDMYNALADDATSVASLIVEPVFYEALILDTLRKFTSASSSLSDSLGFSDHRDKNVLNFVTVVIIFPVFWQIMLPL